MIVEHEEYTGYKNKETGAELTLQQYYGTIKGEYVSYIVKLVKPNGNKVTLGGDTKYNKAKNLLEENKPKIETGFFQ